LPRKSLSDTFFPFSSGKVKSGALSLISMRFSPLRQPLYRSAGRVVILTTLALIFAQIVAAQYGRTGTVSKGPRALALIELAPSGKARLIPVTILYNGQFYDASVYKADPVPMALESGTIYEGERTGTSQGLFTVTGALQVRNSWVGQGTWQPKGAAPPQSRKAALPARPPDEDVEGPPRLRRPSSERPKPTEPTLPPAQAPAVAPASNPATPPAPSPASADTDHPVLRRGKPLPSPPQEPAQASSPAPVMKGAAQTVRIFPAISDAGGPEPMPFTYDLKPEEEQQFRQKMLALASAEVEARAKRLASETIEAAPPARPARRGKAAVKAPQPSFDDVQLRVFDLASNNEPVLVLTAKAHMPQRPATTATGLQYYVTLVARNDIYGELHKVLVDTTDNQHMDVEPRLELVDAVDADGDGRGDLLLRQISDAGSVFVVDRVIGDQVRTLFQGTLE